MFKRRVAASLHSFQARKGLDYRERLLSLLPERAFLVFEVRYRPYQVELVAKSASITCARKVEKNIHEQIRGYRIDGEWFELPEDVAERVSNFIENLSQ